MRRHRLAFRFGPLAWRQVPDRTSAVPGDRRERACAAGACVSWVGARSLLTHVKEAESRQPVMNEQLLLHELMLDLAKLHDTHAAAIRGEFARCVFLEADEQVLRRGGGERGIELFFQHGERS